MVIEQTLEQIIANGDLLHRWLHGADDEEIMTLGGPIPTIANLARRASQVLTTSWSTNSATSHAAELGTKVFEVAASKAFSSQQWVLITNPECQMVATVASYVNTTLTVDVKVVKGTGTFNSWVITLSGPPGAAGDDGDDGAPGPAGKSNYELAVESGLFTGTLEEYLASLHGKPGEPGPPGSGGEGPPRVIFTLPWEEVPGSPV